MPDWLDIVYRSIIFLIVLFFVTKWLGKKQMSELSFFEYVTGITIGAIAAEVAMGLERNLINGILGIVIFASAPFLAELLSLKSKKFRDFVEGKATIFIKDGKIMEGNLKQEKYTTDDLLELLRKKDVFQVADVEFALMEPTGELSVLLKKENQPLTPKDMNITVPHIKEPQTVIMDGKILDEPLSTIGLNRSWLKTELEKQGVALENVFLGQVNSYGQLTVDLYDDQRKFALPQKKQWLLNSIKETQSDLETFALQMKSETAKEMLTKNTEEMKKALDNISHLLKQ